jgi:hypothetical protein
MADYLAVMLPASLPRENYDLLKSLFLHFHKVVQHKDITKMVRTTPLIRSLRSLWRTSRFFNSYFLRRKRTWRRCGDLTCLSPTTL